MAELTEKQKRFVAEYLIDLNATQAAIRAGYSEKTAYSMGQRLLKNVEIQQAIAEAMQKRADRTEITQDRVLKELAALGFYDIADYAAVDGGHAVLKATADIPKEKRAAIVSIKEGQGGLEVKLADKLRALEMIGKHLGMFTEMVKINGDIDNTITFRFERPDGDNLMG